MTRGGWRALDVSWLPVLALLACDTGQSPVTGIGEPMVVHGGQFIEGDLPGARPPPDDGGVARVGDAGAGALAVLSVTFAGTQVVPGVSGDSFGGDVTARAAAVGVRLGDLGTGYWIVPVGAPDTQVPGALTFKVSTGFDADDAPGLYPLRFVAIDGAGNAGTQTDVQICIDSRIPDNGHGCTPAASPPAAVLTLQWDTAFDLDLHVVTPSGADINPKTRVGEPIEAGLRAIPPDVPFIDRDSFRNCIPDGLHQEDLVFQDPMPKGAYEIYVDPFAACGQAAVHFKLTVTQVSGKCPACTFAPTATKTGELLASQVTGGIGPPLFVDQIFVE
jgi:hypothetical protein